MGMIIDRLHPNSPSRRYLIS